MFNFVYRYDLKDLFDICISFITETRFIIRFNGHNYSATLWHYCVALIMIWAFFKVYKRFTD